MVHRDARMLAQQVHVELVDELFALRGIDRLRLLFDLRLDLLAAILVVVADRRAHEVLIEHHVGIVDGRTRGLESDLIGALDDRAGEDGIFLGLHGAFDVDAAQLIGRERGAGDVERTRIGSFSGFFGP